MNRLSLRALAPLAAFALTLAVAAPSAAQRKLISPQRGEANVEITKPNTKVVKGEVITVIMVKNVSPAPIALLKVEENWYDKGGNPIGGDIFRHLKPFMPGEVLKVELRSPRRPGMDSNQYQFSHANGTIKTTVVPKLELPPTS